ncbi:peptidylprolyl isomerase [Sphingopyxis solisilvae]|uniref:peptidylprolyl isomerase n=1 Tax=Sphingopyxis solisilvae TaxID=1886788 RepID=UPI00189288F2|nr:peptidylprolyl isomerase [Sphingopyxis solisilvae]
MKHLLLAAAAASLALPVTAQEPAPIPSPGEIAAAAPASDWIAIAPSDLLVMDLAPDAKGKPRRVVIQLMPAPFSQGWIGNIRKLAAAHWWDGTSVNRVQDNYVVQWGDATEKKALPEGLVTVAEDEYVSKSIPNFENVSSVNARAFMVTKGLKGPPPAPPLDKPEDVYTGVVGFAAGFPMAAGPQFEFWPVHCYGMVGVGRNLSPDTGTGAELYTVIGHAPRHLDQNIALVGRVISGIEHLSSLPRGTGALGFYETEAERVPIASVRIATELPAAGHPRFEYLSTESDSFARYADARANRRDPFFIRPAGGADICNIPVPVRVAGDGK